MIGSANRSWARYRFRHARRTEPKVSASKSSAPRYTAAKGSRAAVVTTVKDFHALAESWCAYHLAIGFEHLYVYFDDPSEPATINLSARFSRERLTCIPHDVALRAAWMQLQHVSTEVVAHAKNEVQTRQQLNARHAVGLAHAHGLDWLLHVDADELFYPGPHGDAARHFRELTDRQVATYCYLNHEAVPEAHGIADPFKEVSLFKRNFDTLPSTADCQAAVRFWQDRQAGSFFYYYDNGKAAVRVHPDARPLSVHEWLPGTKEGMSAWYSNLTGCWAGRGQLGGIVQYLASRACILHYPCYNEDVLYVRWRRGNDNYRLRGREDPPPLHALVCKTADEAAARGGIRAARDTIRRFFEQKVMLLDKRESEYQILAGACERFTLPGKLLLCGAPAASPGGATGGR